MLSEARNRAAQESNEFNTYHSLADMFHAVAILLILIQLRVNKDARGISLKTQILHLIVCCARFIPSFLVGRSSGGSKHLTFIKVFYIMASIWIVIILRFQCSVRYRPQHDISKYCEHLVLPCTVVTAVILLYSPAQTTLHAFWVFSVVVEGVEMIPQLLLMQYYRDYDTTCVIRYILCMWMYRTIDWMTCRTNYESKSAEQDEDIFTVLTFICGVFYSLSIIIAWIIRSRTQGTIQIVEVLDSDDEDDPYFDDDKNNGLEYGLLQGDGDEQEENGTPATDEEVSFFLRPSSSSDD